jgi:hypothetical protein
MKIFTLNESEEKTKALMEFHRRLKELWCRLLGLPRLPVDHFHVFKAITGYSCVSKEKAYERLGYFGEKPSKDGRNHTRGYLKPYNQIPKRLCGSTEFRQKIAGGDGGKTIIEKNYKPYGIPQGAPLSDVLANLYLIDFDETVASWVRELEGAYYRYSDDLLIVAPGGEFVGRDILQRLREIIGEYGSKLEIKKEKTSLFVFHRDATGQRCELLEGAKGKNGLEHLGFRYDGKRVFLRDSTLTNLRRKVARAAYRKADACVRRYPDKDAVRIKLLFNHERLIKRFGKVEDFGESHGDYRKWTFCALGKPILRQLKGHRASIRRRVDKAIEDAVIRRERRKAARQK